MGPRIRRLGLALLFALLGASAAEATQRSVCAANCDFLNTQLQAAIDATVAGDELLLQTNFTYSGQFVLKAFTCAANNSTCYATIRTGVTAAGVVMANSLFPAPNIRIDPSYASVLAKCKPTANNDQCIQTADPPAVVKWWHIKWFEIVPGGNTVGWNGGSMMRLGRDDNTQANKSLIPGNFWLEQIYMHGDKVKGQFRGLEDHANNVLVQDSDIRDIKVVGTEGQAIWGNSFETGLTVINSYLEAAGETFLQGGSGGCCRHNIAVLNTPAPTVNGATLASTPPDLAIGNGISVVVGGLEQYVEVLTISGAAITWTPALNAVPDVPGNVNYGLVPKNITFQKNYITKQLSWRNPIMGTPQSVSASPNEIGGTLGAGTYAYRVVAKMITATNQTTRSTASVEASATIIGATGSVTVTWAAVANAETYDVYGRTAGGQNIRFTVTAPTTTFTDTGTAGTTASVPTTTGSVWDEKNTFELKNADTVLIEGNIIENSWKFAQRGTLMLLTPANTGNSNDSTTVRNVTIRNNIFRHATGLFQITCRDVNFTVGPSGRTINMSITNNLSYDIDSTYGQADRIFYVSKGAPGAFPTANTTEPNTITCKDLTVDHNTFDQSTRQNSFGFLDDLVGGVNRKNEHLVWTNNITVKGSYGLNGAGGCIQGLDCWTRFTDVASVWNKNVIADAACDAYPGGVASNFCPSYTALQGNFVSYANRDYRLSTSSPYHNAATDGTDIGANIALITPFTDIATSGDNTGAPPVAPPVIQTTALPSGTSSAAYTTTLTAINCGGGCSWSILSGSLISGLTLSGAGVISGVPTDAGTATFTVQAAVSGRTTSKDFTLTIANAPTPSAPTDVRPTRVDFVENGIFLRDTEPNINDDRVRFGDAWIDSTARVWKWLYDTAPTPIWAEFVQKVNGSAVPSLGATGTPSATTFLRGDNAWAVPPGGGTAAVPFVNIALVTSSTTSATWTLATTANEAFSGQRTRTPYNLTGYTQCRLWAKATLLIAGATATIWPQYSADGGATWADLGTVAQTPAIAASTFNDIGTFVNIATGAKTDVWLRLQGVASATPTTQPAFGNMGLSCK